MTKPATTFNLSKSLGLLIWLDCLPAAAQLQIRSLFWSIMMLVNKSRHRNECRRSADSIGMLLHVPVQKHRYCSIRSFLIDILKFYHLIQLFSVPITSTKQRVLPSIIFFSLLVCKSRKNGLTFQACHVKHILLGSFAPRYLLSFAKYCLRNRKMVLKTNQFHKCSVSNQRIEWVNGFYLNTD